jgi:flavorubredoxin
VVDDKRTITLGGTTLELLYLGKNHSDSTLVMRLPKEKIIFTVDWIPIQGVQFRGMADTYLPDTEDGLKKVLRLIGKRSFPAIPAPVASRPAPRTMPATSLLICRTSPQR